MDYYTISETLKKYSPALLRIGMAVVFLYFGISQLQHPQSFVGWLPKEVSLIPISSTTFVILNGAFETFFGTLLLLGIWTRLSAALLGLHLLGITFTIGFTEVGMRDLGLALATIALAMFGTTPLGIDDSREEPSTPDKAYYQNQEQRQQ